MAHVPVASFLHDGIRRHTALLARIHEVYALCARSERHLCTEIDGADRLFEKESNARLITRNANTPVPERFRKMGGLSKVAPRLKKNFGAKNFWEEGKKNIFGGQKVFGEKKIFWEDKNF